METIQVVLDKKLLRALEERDREGYATTSRTHDESAVWEAEATWPAESPARIVGDL